MKQISFLGCFLGVVAVSLWGCVGKQVDGHGGSGGDGGAAQGDGGSTQSKGGSTQSKGGSTQSKGGSTQSKGGGSQVAAGGGSQVGAGGSIHIGTGGSIHIGTGGSIHIGTGGSIHIGTGGSRNGTTSSSSTTAGGSIANTGQGGATSSTGGRSSATSVAGSSSLGGGAPTADKLDLLLMIDNSLSMGDKQAVLAAAVPQLLGRLTNPDCVSEDGTQRVSMLNATPGASCPTGLRREFAPVNDIHIGTVTSSLGDFGGDVCPENTTENFETGFPDQNDHGWLLGALPRNAGVLSDRFLAWSINDAGDATRLASKTKELTDFVAAAGEIGCGLEMSLESWYRFLIDPDPPQDVIAGGTTNAKGKVLRVGYPAGQNPILEQRAAFLRSDSLVAVVMLTDENDCSLRDSGAYSWVPAYAGGNFRSWKASSVCATNPNDPCCYSCIANVTGEIPTGCAVDPICEGDAKLMAAEDPTGLRCFQMKKRFGFDFLFPVTRYSNALSLKQLCPNQTYGDLDCNCTAAKAKGLPCEPGGEPIPNPLYQNLSGAMPTGRDRDDASAVFFAGIVGVPWQDLATQASLDSASAPLELKPARELNWDLFSTPDIYAQQPSDPHMVEAIAPRVGLPGPDSSHQADSINGHEWNSNGSDLQFACIFSLEELNTRNCVASSYCPDSTDLKCRRSFVGCSCAKAVDGYTDNSPICQKADGAYSTEQRYAKAYPGTRELQALRAFHEQNHRTNNAIVASICPKTLANSVKGTSAYGYNPAVAALMKQLALSFKQ